ncbi:MAG: NUDIX hydrolase [Fibrobacterota bacterium]|nr:NUDIX hydrolase [Fibrobacterota bacterium]QQS04231.1 MAG: NUDIX hydrolase [Fibrobacterota bacterium]
MTSSHENGRRRDPEDDSPVWENRIKIGPWTQISRAVTYNNPWIRVEHHEVQDPSGRQGVYGVVHFKNRALACVPLHEDGTVTLVGQHRYPLDLWTWEIPEGGGRPDADPLDEMKRELMEEAGLSASEWIHLGLIHTSNSVCDETAHLWLARGLTEGSLDRESTEGDMKLMRVPFAEAVAMALDGRITDALTVAALFRASWWLASPASQS